MSLSGEAKSTSSLGLACGCARAVQLLSAAALRGLSLLPPHPRVLRSVALKRLAKIPKGAPTYSIDSMVLKQGVLGGFLGDFDT